MKKSDLMSSRLAGGGAATETSVPPGLRRAGERSSTSPPIVSNTRSGLDGDVLGGRPVTPLVGQPVYLVANGDPGCAQAQLGDDPDTSAPGMIEVR